jgi:hypothetical protein
MKISFNTINSLSDNFRTYFNSGEKEKLLDLDFVRNNPNILKKMCEC